MFYVLPCVILCFSVLFSIAITSLGEERANLSAFRMFVRFVLVWICRFPPPLGAWEGLRFVIVALPGLFSFLFFFSHLGHFARKKIQQTGSNYLYLLQRNLKFHVHGQTAAAKTCLINIHEIFDDLIAEQ